MELRLQLGHTRLRLSELSSVPVSTIKRFETTGEIGTKALVHILLSLEAVDPLGEIARAKAPTSVKEMLKPARHRGLRSDAGKSRVDLQGASS